MDPVLELSIILYGQVRQAQGWIRELQVAAEMDIVVVEFFRWDHRR
jgi:hypothetical protein